MADRRRLLVSLFNAEEVRTAAAGGADIIDCEDARSKVGMFKPRTIGSIAYAVRQNDTEGRLRISANIGFDLTLYQKGPSGAVARSLEEVQAKAAQEALGIAAAMDTGDHRPNIVKCGVDGLPKDWVKPVVQAVKSALAESYRFQDHQVICGIIETHLPAWNARKSDPKVIRNLVNVGQFHFDTKGKIDITKQGLTEEQVKGFMNGVTDDPHASLIEPYDPKSLGWPTDPKQRLRMLCDAISEGGADGAMIDTPVSAKMSSISLLRLADNPADEAKLKDTAVRIGVFDLPFLRWFSEYCAFRFMECWLAGSINAEHAKAIGGLEHVDVVLNRGTSSEEISKLFPSLAADGEFEGQGDARFARRIRAANVISMAEAVAGK